MTAMPMTMTAMPAMTAVPAMTAMSAMSMTGECG
jgi:hypothetical protein